MRCTMKKTMIASSVALALGVPTVQAELVTNLGPNETKGDETLFSIQIL